MANSNRDVRLAELRERHPDWYVWYVAKAQGKTVWSAGKPSNMIATYEAHTADELEADLSSDSDLWLTLPTWRFTSSQVAELSRRSLLTSVHCALLVSSTCVFPGQPAFSAWPAVESRPLRFRRLPH